MSRALLALLVLAGACLGQRSTHRWVFEPDAVDGRVVRAAAGERGVALSGNARVGAAPVPGGLLLGARADRASFAPSLAVAGLPDEDLSVEAWVSVDDPQKWGGIVGAIQDDGGVEKGWLLGYRGDRFCFALSTEGADDGDGLLTYMDGVTQFAFGRWFHVVATYDGKDMRLFVDGELEAESEVQSGPILYPPSAFCEIGGYHDADEDYAYSGWIGEVAIYDRALTRSAVKRAYRKGRSRWQLESPAESAEGGAVAEWHLDARLATPTGLRDASGEREVHLEGAAAARWTELPGNLAFDGDTAAARLSVGALPPMATSVEAFALMHDPDRGGPLVAAYEQTADGEERGWVIDCAASRWRFGLASEDGAPGLVRVQNAVEVQPFQWYHLVATYDGSVQRLYVDGVQVGAVRGALGNVALPAANEVLLARRDDAAGAHRAAIQVHRASLWDRALRPEEVRALHAQARAAVPRPLAPSWGPLARFEWPDAVVIEWGTAEPSLGGVELQAPGGVEITALEEEPTSAHRVRLSGLARETEHELRVLSVEPGGELHRSRSWELDTSFDYELALSPERPSPYDADDGAEGLALHAERILEELGRDRGWALVLEAGDGRLAYELAVRSELRVVAVEQDPARVALARARLLDAGLYGTRVSVHTGDRSSLPYGDWTFDLVVSQAEILGDAPVEQGSEELERVLRPDGGVHVALDQGPGRGVSPYLVRRRGAVPNTGTWTHQYGGPHNAAASEEQLVKGPMTIQWFGRPGPRPMTDRGARPPAPLYAAGRLYVQGMRRLFGLDAYNGTILWTLEAPRLIRSNLPRDCSNMVCDERGLFVAMDDHLFELDGDTGATVRRLPTPSPVQPRLGEGARSWGYVALAQGLLLGSVCREDAIYRGTNGEWYDGVGDQAEAVLGEELFALDRETGERVWTRAALFPQATVTLHDGQVLLVEERSPSPRSLAAGRLVDVSGDEVLVALDLATGEVRWERPVDLSGMTRTLYCAAAGDVVLVSGTGNGYLLRAFDAAGGEPLWQREHGWSKDHHGGAMQHPVLVGGRVFSENKVFDLHSGAPIAMAVPTRRGCGTMSASANALFFRDYFHTMWDPETGDRTDWGGFRSGCWIAMLPAGGLLLLPEASSGCSCKEPFQTSAAYRPAGGAPE